jgi:hypothetical protein
MFMPELSQVLLKWNGLLFYLEFIWSFMVANFESKSAPPLSAWNQIKFPRVIFCYENTAPTLAA